MKTPMAKSGDVQQRWFIVDASQETLGRAAVKIARILQGKLPVDPNETADELCARVQSVEHKIYPEAANWSGQGRLEFRNGQAWLDGRRLVEPVVSEFG